MSALYLVRHGQAAFGSDDYDRLSATGAEQCRILARHWRSLARPDPIVYSGRLERQRASAEAFARELAGLGGAPGDVRLVDGLEEYEHISLLADHQRRSPGDAPQPAGPWAERRLFHLQLVAAVEAWVRGEIEGPEPFGAFRARCAAALGSVIDLLGQGGTGVVFGSAGSLAAAMQPILGIGDQELMRLTLNFYNTGVSRLLCSGASRTVESINSIAHLEQPATMHLITYR